MTPYDTTTFDPRIADWLEDDPNNAPDQALDIVLAAFPSIKQRHASRLPRRFTMTTLPRLALGAVAAIVVIVLAGAFLVRPPASGVGGGGPTPSPSTPPASVAPSAPPSPSPSAASGPMDTSTWTSYTSTRYGFTIGHPADWSVIPSDRLWAFPADTTCCPPPGTETFLSAPGDVGVSVWSVALPKGTTTDAWIEAYCKKMEPEFALHRPAEQHGRGEHGRPCRPTRAVRERHAGFHTRRRHVVHRRVLETRKRPERRVVRRCQSTCRGLPVDDAPPARRSGQPGPVSEPATVLTIASVGERLRPAFAQLAGLAGGVLGRQP